MSDEEQTPAAAAAAVAAEAGIRMLNPARCLDQLSRHAEHLRDRSVGLRAHAHADAPSVQAVERSGAGVTLVLDDGRCLLRVDEGVLSVRVEAADEAGLRRIQHVIGADVARFGAREALEVTWRMLGRTCEG